jgi:hypothetical protein
MKRILLLCVCISIVVPLFSQVNLTGYKLIASYPLQTNGKEEAGRLPDMNLTGAYSFKNGGIYSNGIYGAGGTFIGTPTIDSMKLNDFVVMLDFKVETDPTTWDPLFMIGELWRFIGIGLYKNDSTLMFYFNGNSMIYNRSLFKYKMNTWYAIALKHKTNFSTLYVNDKIEITHNAAFDLGSNINETTHRRITNTHSGLGITYKGYWRNLKVYAPGIAQSFEELSALGRNIVVYPNPSNGTIIINYPFTLKEKSVFVSIINSGGQQVFEQEINGPLINYQLQNRFSPGIYYLQLKTGKQNLTQKVVIQ